MKNIDVLKSFRTKLQVLIDNSGFSLCMNIPSIKTHIELAIAKYTIHYSYSKNRWNLNLPLKITSYFDVTVGINVVRNKTFELKVKKGFDIVKDKGLVENFEFFIFNIDENKWFKLQKDNTIIESSFCNFLNIELQDYLK